MAVPVAVAVAVAGAVAVAVAAVVAVAVERRRWRDGIFGSLDGAVVMRVGGRREGAKETAVVHLAAARAPAHAAA